MNMVHHLTTTTPPTSTADAWQARVSSSHTLQPPPTHAVKNLSDSSCGVSLVQFKYADFYWLNPQWAVKKPLSGTVSQLSIIPRQAGCELVAQYYANKYGAQISFPKNTQNNYIKFSDFCFTVDFAQIDSVRLEAGKYKDYRHAFYWGPLDAPVMPGGDQFLYAACGFALIYIKENRQEALFLISSNGNYIRCVEAVTDHVYSDGKKIPIYVSVQEDRVNAVESECHLSQPDANFIETLNMVRDCTAICKDTGVYRIPCLLQDLQNRCQKIRGRATNNSDHFLVKLPNSLLKTPQSSSYVAKHREVDNPIIHKKETLPRFRARHTELFGRTRWDKPNDELVWETVEVSTYLRKIGLHAADQIEIQFYLNQLNNLPHMTEDLTIRFIAEAKTEFRRQLKEYDVNEDGLMNLQAE